MLKSSEIRKRFEKAKQIVVQQQLSKRTALLIEVKRGRSFSDEVESFEEHYERITRN